MEVINLIAPIFAIMVTGYVLARTNVLPESLGGGLIQFVYYAALPALLFGVIAQEDITKLADWPFIVALGGIVFGLFFVILVGAIVLKRSALGAATMLAVICVGANTGIIGLPLLHALFGHKVIIYAALANIIIVSLFLVQIIILELAGSGVGSTFVHIRRAILNPIILSTILGVVYAILPIDLPKIVADYVDLLGAALAPCALFAIGMSIKPASVVNSGPTILFVSAVKLVIMPALVLAVALALDMDALLTIAAVVSAAVPTAKSEFILAEQYHQSEDLVAGTISATTALAVITLIAWLLILAQIFPGAFSLS